MKDFGRRLRDTRKAQKMTQKALAKAAGISQPSLSELETGETKEISGPTLVRLAKALGVMAEWLLLGKGGGDLEEIETQLLVMYRQLSPDGKDAAFGNVNRLLRKEQSSQQEGAKHAKREVVATA